MNIRKKVFAKEEVNTGRQGELDLARAVLIICLPLVHCVIECTPDEGLSGGIPYLFDTVIGGPLGAPVFMFVMGAGMAYSRKSSWQQHARRGLLLILASYLFNFCRYTLPFLLGYAVTGDYAHYITPLPYYTFMNDIFLFAGLAMVLIALLIGLHIPSAVIAGIGLCFSAASMLIGTEDAGSPVGNILLGYLIGTEDAAGMVMSDFPFLCWFIVPAFGYFFGKILRRVQNKDAFYLRLSPICLVFAAAYFAYGIYARAGMFGEGQNCYYHISTPDVLASLITALGFLGLYRFLLYLLPQAVQKASYVLSANLPAYYVIHWILISLTIKVGLYAVRGTQELPVGIALLTAVLIGIVSGFLAVGYGKMRKKAKVS